MMMAKRTLANKEYAKDQKMFRKSGKNKKMPFVHTGKTSQSKN
jgi:hypothetical protein